MKQRWKQWAAKYEALSMRERVMVGAAVIAGLVFVVKTLMIDPALAKEKALRSLVNQQRSTIATMSMDAAQREVAALTDPDKEAKTRLTQLSADNLRMREALRTMQKGLVAPDRMGALLQQLLGNSRLKLVSLKTLPPRGMSDGKFSEPDVAPGAGTAAPAVGLSAALQAAPPAAGAPAQPAKPAVKQEELLYRHGVQIVVEGSYLDMVAYMQALESMPEQLFWGKASLTAQQYPKATLSLTLYTLSLDQKWIAL